MGEPCRHERAGASDEIRSFVGTVQALVKVERERDEALATIAGIRTLLLIADHGPQCAVWGQVPARGGGPGPCDCVLDRIEDALGVKL